MSTVEAFGIHPIRPVREEVLELMVERLTAQRDELAAALLAISEAFEDTSLTDAAVVKAVAEAIPKSVTDAYKAKHYAKRG